MLGKTDLSFSIVVISDDVSHSVAEGEFGVLLVVLNRIRYLSLDHRCGGIFCELVPLDGPSCLEVEEFLAASRIYPWGSAGYNRDVQRIWIIMNLCVCSKWLAAVLVIV